MSSAAWRGCRSVPLPGSGARPPSLKRRPGAADNPSAMNLDALLADAVAAGASDVHLKIGRPPLIRRDGAVGPLEGAGELTEEDLDACLRQLTASAPERYEVLPADRRPRHRLHRPRSAPFPRQRLPPARIDLFCPPCHSAQGAALQRSRPPAGSRAACRGAPRARARHGRDRLGQVDDARCDRRPRQPDPGLAHRHDRGSARVSPPGPDVDRQPARGRPRHRELRPGASARASPGPRHDPDRRASRRRDGANGPSGSGIRAPRLFDPAHDRRRRDDQPPRRVLPRGQAAADPHDPCRASCAA